ncbi:hypothetical protein OE88DRAFT_1642918 [Heliocybe sulcata]|uniref:Uncharacterized protein n=1 Tax=Heliocybe sulcata TaxID=5364 RepID=A0A5C3ND78_9AGAM|nr:hypothetical protein OE88DRAFT_1642918 [Heliocybe sulcata]
MDELHRLCFMAAPPPCCAGAAFNVRDKVSWFQDMMEMLLKCHVPIFFFWSGVARFQSTDWRSIAIPVYEPFFPSEAEVAPVLDAYLSRHPLPPRLQVLPWLHEDCPPPPSPSSSHPQIPPPRQRSLSPGAQMPPPRRRSLSPGAHLPLPVGPHREPVARHAEGTARLQLIPGSGGQHRGKTCQEFLARREARHKAIYAKASAEQMRTYRAREEAQRSFPCPGRKGAMVYKWSVVDKDRNIHQWCVVNQGNVSDMWGSIDHKYMVYDAVDNCWDCYQDLHLPQYTIDSYKDNREDEDDFGEGIMFMPPPTPPSAPLNAPPATTTLAPRAGPSTSQATTRSPPSWPSISQAASRPLPLQNTWLSTSQAASGPPPLQNAAIVPNAPVLMRNASHDDFLYSKACTVVGSLSPILSIDSLRTFTIPFVAPDLAAILHQGVCAGFASMGMPNNMREELRIIQHLPHAIPQGPRTKIKCILLIPVLLLHFIVLEL